MNRWVYFTALFLAVIFLSGLSKTTKWEYKIVLLESEKIMDDLGGQGWELVAVYDRAETTRALYTPAYELNRLRKSESSLAFNEWTFNDWTSQERGQPGIPTGYFKRAR